MLAQFHRFARLTVCDVRSPPDFSRCLGILNDLLVMLGCPLSFIKCHASVERLIRVFLGTNNLIERRGGPRDLQSTRGATLAINKTQPHTKTLLLDVSQERVSE